MEVRAKKALGQHFLTDQRIAKSIVEALRGDVALEVGPGMGVLTQYLLKRQGMTLKAVELDGESVAYLKKNFPDLGESLIEGDFLKMDLGGIFEVAYSVIGNFPYNISSQIFFKILERRDQIPEVVCMIQKEVAQRIAEKPGTKTYGILSVFLQAWYDIDYLFTVGPGSFNPPPKVQSAVIRLTRNSRRALGCDEKLFRTIVKTSFGQRRKTLRNSLKALAISKFAACGSDGFAAAAGDSFAAGFDGASAAGSGDSAAAAGDSFAAGFDCASAAGSGDSSAAVGFNGASFTGSDGSASAGLDASAGLGAAAGIEASAGLAASSPDTAASFLADPVFNLRPERLSVEDFINLTNRFQ